MYEDDDHEVEKQVNCQHMLHQILACGIKAALKLLRVHLTDPRCLPYFNLPPHACQNVNIVCSPVFLLQFLHDP